MVLAHQVADLDVPFDKLGLGDAFADIGPLVQQLGAQGGGMVEVTLSGRMECRRVRIDPSVLSDPEMAEDLIAAAFNDAVNKVNTQSAEKMAAATAGMNLPPGMKMPF